jgi:hypothetical protein
MNRPTCGGAPMVLRRNRQNGNQFWACRYQYGHVRSLFGTKSVWAPKYRKYFAPK